MGKWHDNNQSCTCASRLFFSSIARTIVKNHITITVNSSAEALGYVDELKLMGLKAGVDFTWRFNARRGDYFTYGEITKANVTFTFINESLLSWAELKWG